MPNEIIVRVKVIEDDGNKAIRQRLETQASDLGEKIAINVNQKVTERLEKDAQTASSDSGGYARVGDKIGDTIGKHVSERISERIKVDVNGRMRDRFIGGGGNGRERITVNDREHVKVDVDVDKQSLLQKLGSFGGQIQDKVAGWFDGGIKTGISSVFSGDVISTMFKGGLIALAVGTLAPAIAAALAAAVLTALSGGAIAIGVIGAIKDPRIMGALKSLKDEAKGVFASFAENFKGPLEEFFAPSNKGGGGIVGLFHQLTPLIDQLGKTLGPVTAQLGNGIIGFLQNVLPAIITGMQAGAPLIETLAKRLPGIGDAIAELFNTISAHADDANTFFNDLLHTLEFLIKAIGWVIGAFSDMYMVVRGLFVALIGAVLEWAHVSVRSAEIAFGWMPGIGPKLHKAAAEFNKFSANVIRNLNAVPDDKYIDIHLRTILNGVGTSVGAITRQLKGIGYLGKATGGAIGTAATGGARNGMTLVGEHGPELADLAPGSNVYSNADSMRMAGQGGGGGPVVINLLLDGKTIARAMVDPQRDFVRNSFGGSVQAAYGS